MGPQVGTQAPWVSMLQGKFAACTTDLNTGQMSETEGGSPAWHELRQLQTELWPPTKASPKHTTASISLEPAKQRLWFLV